MKRTQLHDNWTMQAGGGSVPDAVAHRTIPAAVPGCAHTDLMSAGLMPDPYLDMVEDEVVWAHRANWTYERPIDIARAAPDERVDLVFEGLDTVATVRLGDTELGRTRNQHRTYRFDVRDHAGAGDATLQVAFASALIHAEEEESRVGARPRVYPTPMNMVRKMACSFGWDWGPNLQTAGIWRPVLLERWRTARLESVRPIVSVDPDGSACVLVHVDVERSGLEGSGTQGAGTQGAGTQKAESALTVDVRLSRGSDMEHGTWNASVEIPAGSSAGSATVVVTDPQLWWPVGYGQQPLYDLDVTLSSTDADAGNADTDNAALDTWHRRIGLRTVTLDTDPDDHGTSFVLRVNGEPVFVRGANWIPDDHFVSRITRDRLDRRITQAVGANLNLLRVWGGGIYESEDFYDLCDEAGIMVWQDFLLACAAYPEEEPHRSEFEAEAREHVARLTPIRAW